MLLTFKQIHAHEKKKKKKESVGGDKVTYGSSMLLVWRWGGAYVNFGSSMLLVFKRQGLYVTDLETAKEILCDKLLTGTL